MQILGILGMYFDAVVLESQEEFTFIQVGSGHTVGHVVQHSDQEKPFQWSKGNPK